MAIQAAFYAWMLHIDFFCMVCSFLEDEDYEAPDSYECNETNTIIKILKVSEFFPEFDNKVIRPAMKWWEDYIETGVSPEFDEERDKDILEQLRMITAQEKTDEDEYYDRLAREYGDEEEGDMLSFWYHLSDSTLK